VQHGRAIKHEAGLEKTDMGMRGKRRDSRGGRWRGSGAAQGEMEEQAAAGGALIYKLKVSIVHADGGSEHEAPQTGVKTVAAQDDKRTMTGYSIHRSPNHKIRRLARQARVAAPSGIYSSVPVLRRVHFTTLPFKVGPR